MKEFGYYATSGNGRGKTFFHKDLKKVIKDAKKHKYPWDVYYGVKIGEDTFIAIERIKY